MPYIMYISDCIMIICCSIFFRFERLSNFQLSKYSGVWECVNGVWLFLLCFSNEISVLNCELLLRFTVELMKSCTNTNRFIHCHCHCHCHCPLPIANDWYTWYVPMPYLSELKYQVRFNWIALLLLIACYSFIYLLVSVWFLTIILFLPSCDYYFRFPEAWKLEAKRWKID